jgi:hypothetical protein
VLFRGSQPVFIDVPSFEKRAVGDPMWKPYAQFVRTFLLPLLACRTWGDTLAGCFITRRDGLEPEQLFRRCGWLQRLRPPFLGLVTLPAWLSRSGEAQGTYRERLMADAAKARFILEMTLKRLPRLLDQTQPRPKRASTWSDYMATHSYNDDAFKLKESFVREALAEARPDWVLDVGANTGHFSALAASAGASVVALDSDVQCVDGIWRRARAQNLDILPLVVDFARSSPALGWRNREQPSFLERARGSVRRGADAGGAASPAGDGAHSPGGRCWKLAADAHPRRICWWNLWPPTIPCSSASRAVANICMPD